MEKKNKEYTEDGKKRKTILIAFLLSMAFIFIVGIVAAYYSDIAGESSDYHTNTLKIQGDYTFYLNEVETSIENITLLNPGDVIVVRGTVTNLGNQSAWIREKISFDFEDVALLPYVNIYAAELTQEDLLAVPQANYPLAFIDDSYVAGSNRVINGAGENAQIEGGGGYTYINSDSYSFVFTIYFSHTAPNSTQDKYFGITIATQALQFKNNNATEPDEVAWAGITAA